MAERRPHGRRARRSVTSTEPSASGFDDPRRLRWRTGVRGGPVHPTGRGFFASVRRRHLAIGTLRPRPLHLLSGASVRVESTWAGPRATQRPSVWVERLPSPLPAALRGPEATASGGTTQRPRLRWPGCSVPVSLELRRTNRGARAAGSSTHRFQGSRRRPRPLGSCPRDARECRVGQPRTTGTPPVSGPSSMTGTSPARVRRRHLDTRRDRTARVP